MKIYLLLLLSFFFHFNNSFAQVIRCSTDEHQLELDKAFPKLAELRLINEEAITRIMENNTDYRNSSLLTIPIVFHILYFNASQNVPTNRIIDQVEVLNQDYSRTNSNAVNTRPMFIPVASNTQIQFCLAQRTPTGEATDGIIRIQTSSATLPNNLDSISPEWDHNNYLNVYVGALSGNVLGYTNFPPGTEGNDHVVILYSSLGGFNYPGTITSYNHGRTLTHEVGHWLDLLHVFSGCGGNTNFDCLTAGDKVCDTPPESQAIYGCPVNNPNTCTEMAPFPSPYTSDMLDMYENYLDYSDDDCMNIFTSGQAARMNSAISIYRSSLFNSKGCEKVNGNEIPDANLISIIPNPSVDGIFHVKFSSLIKRAVAVDIFDASGKYISRQVFNYPFYSTTAINLSKFAIGFYEARFDTDNGKVVLKLVMNRR